MKLKIGQGSQGYIMFHLSSYNRVGPKLHSPIGSCNFTGAHKTLDFQRQPPSPSPRYPSARIKILMRGAV
jgi:hypothetical protein